MIKIDKLITEVHKNSSKVLQLTKNKQKTVLDIKPSILFWISELKNAQKISITFQYKIITNCDDLFEISG